MKKIWLRGKRGYGKFTVVDDKDFKYLSEIKWFLSAKGYVVGNVRNGETKPVHRKMHRIIINAPTGREVDHKDRNKLNNRRGNLRLATSSENNLNRGAFKLFVTNTTGFAGVSKVKSSKKYRAYYNGKHIGMFSTALDANKARENYLAENYGK